MCMTFVYDAFPLREFARTLCAKIVCNFVSKLREVFLFVFYGCKVVTLDLVYCCLLVRCYFVFEFYN